MSTVGAVLTTWEEFAEMDAEDGTHLELHDGEVVVVPAPKPTHTFRQGELVDWFTAALKGRGKIRMELPYRPAENLQFWFADVAYLTNEDWRALDSDDYLVYSPPLIIEVLSPSNRRSKLEQQRRAAFSGGTREFWVVDSKSRAIEVFVVGKPARIYRVGEKIPVTALPGLHFPVKELFRS
ncbi:MAG TPA: Uma2 family endonuclease [Bryobacteraceae bacterium]|jgi:Uma2 family endonuclease